MIVTFRDIGQLDLDLGQGENVLGGGPGADELVDERLATVGSGQPEAASHQVAEPGPVLGRLGGLGRVVLHGRAAVVGEVGDVHIASVDTPDLAGDSQTRGDPHLGPLQQVLGHGEGGQGHHGGLHGEGGGPSRDCGGDWGGEVGHSRD